MKRRSPLIGFTEAELGFVVAAIVAFSAVSQNRPRAPVRKPQPAVVKPDTTTPDSVKPRPDSLSNVNIRSCSEIGLQRSPLALIDIAGLNRFVLEGDTLSQADLDVRLRPFEEEARAKRCRYTLRFHLPETISARTAMLTQSHFLGHFYFTSQ